MAMLGRIRRQAARPVEFHIFPNCMPLEAAALRAAWTTAWAGRSSIRSSTTGPIATG